MQYRSLTRTIEPVVEPVTLTQAKSHLRIQPDFQDDDDYIIHLIGAARRYAEDLTDRTFVDTQWTMVLDYFPVDEIAPIVPCKRALPDPGWNVPAMGSPVAELIAWLVV